MDKFPNWPDHIVAFIFCILIPWLAIRQNLKTNSAIAYSSKQKQLFYISTCISLFTMAAIVMAVWLLSKRPLAAIGLTFRMEGTTWIWTAAAFIILYILDTTISVATPGKVTGIVDEWQKRTPFMPTIPKELPVYFLMCVCAGVFEEIVFRGFLVSYFQHLFQGSGYQQSVAVILPALVFSVSHFYHGVRNIIKIFILSSLFGLIFIQSGSVVIVMLLHFTIDAIAGLLTVKYMGKIVQEVVDPPDT